MSFDERKRLGHAYETATGKLAEAVRDLNRNIGTSSKAEFDRLQRVSDEARLRSEQARLALEECLAHEG